MSDKRVCDLCGAMLDDDQQQFYLYDEHPRRRYGEEPVERIDLGQCCASRPISDLFDLIRARDAAAKAEAEAEAAARRARQRAEDAAMERLTKAGIKDFRIRRALVGDGVREMADLTERTESELFGLHGITDRGVEAIKKVLAASDLSLKTETADG